MQKNDAVALIKTLFRYEFEEAALLFYKKYKTIKGFETATILSRINQIQNKFLKLNLWNEYVNKLTALSTFLLQKINHQNNISMSNVEDINKKIQESLPKPIESIARIIFYSIGILLDHTIQEIKEKIIVALNNDKMDLIFNSLNNGEIRLNAAGEADYYDILTGDPINNAENNTKMLFQLYPSNIITGTPTTGSSPYTSANIGDPGTIWTEKVAFADDDSDVNLDGNNINTIVQGTFIGNKSLGNETFTGTYPAEYTGEQVEKFYSSYISFQFQPFSYFDYNTIDFKFRFIIEYYQ